MIEERLIELESRLVFQDDTIQKLNDVIIKQQAQIDSLGADILILKSQLRALHPSHVAAESEEIPPPHY